MELEDLFKENKDKTISAFGFNIGRTLEEMVKLYTNNLQETNKQLEARILDFRSKFPKDNPLGDLLRDEYDKTFGIKKV